MADSKSDSIIDGHFATKVGENPPQKFLEQPLDNALWQYACRLYSKAKVETVLLHLQDAHGADINLILQALWLASEGTEWTSASIPDDYIKWVEDQVVPIRAMRRRLKTDWVETRGVAYEDFRQQVKKLELKAEQYALAMLFVQVNHEQREKHTETEVSGTKVLSNNVRRLAEYFIIPPEVMQKTLGELFD